MNYIDSFGMLHIGHQALRLGQDGSITISNDVINDYDDVSNWRAEIVAKVRRLGFEPDWQHAIWMKRKN